METYVLYRYWDTPDNEGNEIMGAYYEADKAIADMKTDAAATKAYYPADFWKTIRPRKMNMKSTLVSA